VPHAALKLAIVALLALNSALYVLDGTAGEALDSAAWYVLLVLFYWETSWRRRPPSAALAHGLHVVRYAAGAAIVIAALEYMREHVWLEAVNAWLWIAVVIALEMEVRYPEAVARRRATFVAVTAVLYAGLLAVTAGWIAEGVWLDAYDALLWLLAFAIVEVDLLAPDAAWRAPRQA
jgi:hypothetical protein